MKTIYLIAVIVFLLSACSHSEKLNSSNSNSDFVINNIDLDKNTGFNFIYKYNDENILIHTPMLANEIISSLGKPLEFIESESCAVAEKEKLYSYKNIEITSYEFKGIEYIFNLMLLDDTVSTKEGISIGSSFDQMVKVYGTSYEEKPNLYTYTKGNSKLEFYVENNIISQIQYYADLPK